MFCLPKTAWPPTFPMAATWVLVADANRARIFSSPTPLAPWYEEADFVNTDRGAKSDRSHVVL